MNTSFVCLKLLQCTLLVSLTVADTTLFFYGDIFDSQPDKIVRMSCLTLVMPFECSMEFLHNNSTVESIRYSNGECFDKFGECKPEICVCSEDCAAFLWNLTSTLVKTNDSFGCKMRIYNSTSDWFYKVYSSAVYNGTGFSSPTSSIYPVDIVATVVQTTPRFSDEKVADWVLIIVAVSVVATLVLMIIIGCIFNKARKMYIRKKKARGDDKTSSQVGSDIPIKELQIGSDAIQKTSTISDYVF